MDNLLILILVAYVLNDVYTDFLIFKALKKHSKQLEEILNNELKKVKRNEKR